MSPLQNKNNEHSSTSPGLDRYQYGSENVPLVSLDGSPQLEESSSTTGRRVRRRWKLQLILGVAIALLVVFVREVSNQAEEEVSTHSITAANALIRLNSNIQHLPPKKCTVTVLIARHCNDYGVYAVADDEVGDKHCSYVGYERTRHFASQFADANASRKEQQHQRWPTPIALYALLPKQKKGINYRQIETLLPLARKSEASINVVGDAEQVASSIFEQLQNTHLDPHNNNITSTENHHNKSKSAIDINRTGTVEENPYCGQVIVIAWKHSGMPELAATLGCGPDQGCPLEYPDNDYDIWQLQFVHEPPAPRNEVPWLLDNDSSLLVNDQYHILSRQQRKELDAAYTIDGYNGPSIHGTGNPYQVHQSQNPGWTVYGTVTSQNFDPLHASYQASDADLRI